METQSGIELVSKTDLLELASWEHARSTEQLLGFIARREAAISDLSDIEDGI